MEPPAHPASHLRLVPVISVPYSHEAVILAEEAMWQKPGPMGILPRDWCIYTEKDPLPTRISEPRACDPEQPATISAAAGGNVNFLQSRGGPTWEAKIVSVGVPTTSFQHLGPALPEVRIHS